MAQKKSMTTNALLGTRVVGGKNGNRRIGKVRRFIFHPSEKRCIGFIVKRPDLLWMFHRKDWFVALDEFQMEDGRVLLEPKAGSSPQAACKRLGVDWDKCVLWVGMPIVTEVDTNIGFVGDVEFSLATGKIKAITVDKGATSKVLLGITEVPASLIKGFKTGIGAELAQMGEEGAQEDNALHGAILVDDAVLDIKPEGGLAESAGQKAAVASDKATQAKAKAKPKVDAAVKKTGDAVNKGAYATGKQIAKTKGMFSAFKEEYDKASGKDDESGVLKKK